MTNVVVIAATNRPDVLDQALLRPGRFDRQVMLEKPDIAGRLSILTVHAEGKPLASNVSMERLAKQTTGMSGADLENLLNEAAYWPRDATRPHPAAGSRGIHSASDGWSRAQEPCADRSGEGHCRLP